MSNITSSDVILLAHAAAGGLGCIAAAWVCAEALNASPANRARLRAAVFLTAFCIVCAWIMGGDWYLHYYPADKARILHGPWPFAHDIFMETKEHLFYLTLILALYLPIASADDLAANPVARRMTITRRRPDPPERPRHRGAGAVINHGAKVALEHSTPRQIVNPTGNPKLSRPSAAFGLSAAAVILFNTILACVKDANPALKAWMKSLAGHDWTTQGIADVLLFIALGFLFASLDLGGRLNSSHASSICWLQKCPSSPA